MATTRCLVFYSWQSDLPNATNRGFIEKALENAAKIIRDDDSIQVEPVIDRDTVGVPGSPEISKTIFGKIAEAQVFVCDISIINQDVINQNPGVRPVPNPNVLVEYGYALRALGEGRIIMILNTVYGEPEQLPFDLRLRKVIKYRMPKESERATERRELEKNLVEALRTILSDLDASLPGEAIQLSLAEQARAAIQADHPSQVGLVRKYMTELASNITAMTPTFAPNEPDRWDEQLVQAIDGSTGIVLEFTRLSETIALMHADTAAKAMYEGFARILDLYRFPPQFQGPPHSFAHDLARFLGYELFVSFFTFLIQGEYWDLIANFLNEDLQARTRDFGPHGAVPFYRISEDVSLLRRRKERLNLKSSSLRSDMLAERHRKGDLAPLVPIEQFAEADFFFYLRTQLQPESVPEYPIWAPWSMLCMQEPPFYLRKAISAQYATQLLKPLGVKDIKSLHTRLQERTDKIVGWWGPGLWPMNYAMAGFDYSAIGSR